MFEIFLSGAVEAFKLFLALLDYRYLCFQILAGLLVLVARTSVFALLLVELGLALFYLRFLALDAGKALIGLLFGLSLNFQLLLAGFKELVFHDYFGLTVGIVDYCLGTRTGCGTLYRNHYRNSDGCSDERRTDVEYYIHKGRE